MKKINPKLAITLTAIAVLLVGAVINVLLKDSNTKTPAADRITTISDIINSPSDIVGKDITLKGQVVELASTGYYLVGQTDKQPTASDPGKPVVGAVKLDFSKSKINPKKYVDCPDQLNTPTTPPDTSASPVPAKNPPKIPTEANVPTSRLPESTIRGRLTQIKATNQALLVVKSIE